MLSVHFSDIDPDVKGIYRTNVNPEHVTFKEKFFYSSRIMLFLKGYGTFNFSGKIFKTAPNSALFVPAMAKYTSEFQDVQQILQVCFDFVHYRDDVFPDMRFRAMLADSDKVYGEEIIIDDNPLFTQPFMVNTISDIPRRADGLFREYREKLNGYQLRLKSMLLDLIVTMQRSYEASSDSIGCVTPDAIIKYINEHCESRLLREELGEVFHYHPNHINRIIKSATNMTLYKYILEAKMHRAEILLANTDMPITQIALQLCFYDSSHFAAAFQQHRGMPPSEYRQMSQRL